MSSPLRRIVAVCTVALIATCVAPSGAQERSTPEQKDVAVRYFAVAPATPPPAPAAPAPAKKDPAAVLAPLQQMLREYADENAVLKERVKELEAQVQRLKENRTITVVPQPGAPTQVPPDWKTVPFNGGVYYVVPLDGESKGSFKLLTEAPVERRRTVIAPPARPTPAPAKK